MAAVRSGLLLVTSISSASGRSTNCRSNPLVEVGILKELNAISPSNYKIRRIKSLGVVWARKVEVIYVYTQLEGDMSRDFNGHCSFDLGAEETLAQGRRNSCWIFNVGGEKPMGLEEEVAVAGEEDKRLLCGKNEGLWPFCNGKMHVY